VVRAQLAVGTGFESNPSDYLEVGEGVAWVTRYGQNESAGAQPHDAGGDILVLDTEAPAITGNILLPTADALPARPVAMTRLGGEVLVSLERNALDFSEMGDAMLVAYDIASGEETRRTTLTGYKSCGKAVLAPDAKRLALACTGRVSWEGVPDSLSQSALLILDATSQKLELLEAYAAEQLAGEPLQSDVAFANARLVLLKTQTPSGGATHNRWLSYELGSATAEALLEASPDAHGAGKGLVYGGMVCLPGCSNLCLMADADQGVLQRAQIRDDGRVELIAPVAVEDTVGLPPVGLGER